jgi:hypothetical protein
MSIFTSHIIEPTSLGVEMKNNLNAAHHIGDTAVAKGKREGKVTQKAMVQAALHEKGADAGPSELQAVIKEKFNVDLSNNVISNYKSIIKREGGASAGAKRVRKPGPEFKDLEAVRGLVTKLGADQVKKLVEMADMFA